MSYTAVTIVDIARELGISKTTVSSALHGNGRVSEATRTLVTETAERLGYVSNRAAQRLRGSRSQSIGLHLFPNSHGRNFYMQFVFGAMEHAADRSLDLTLLTENRLHPRRRSLWADGMLVLDPAPNDPFIEQVSRTGIPVVAVGALSPEQRGLVRGQFSGGQDEFTPIVLERLHAEGVRRPAIVALDEGVEPLWAVQAREIYLDWMRREGSSRWCCAPGSGPRARRSSAWWTRSRRRGTSTGSWSCSRASPAPSRSATWSAGARRSGSPRSPPTPPLRAESSS
ncbi:LacI family DNA-binding transcriptional regulator [Leucobacter soli]|uniref:LacI family DNA-binding transcriptional regulator n=1 Tax=Leucobacter soli TaxID=2812850 RepID=UPI0036192028